ncbi:MAG: hypothetical protein LBL86_05445 [Coriobacteriales bacterium]|jgi:hypothetical protein|nr:hypothetical protein [Coriobacteriales bacterium]
MAKRAVLWIVVYSVFVVLFNACFFLIGGAQHPVSVWLSYAFVHLSYALAVASPSLAKGDAEQRRVIGLPVSVGATVYFFAEFVVGVICILLRAEDWTATFLIQLVLLGLFVLFAAVNLLANSKTDETVRQHRAQVDFLQGNAVVLQSLLSRLQDQVLRKQMEAAYDDLRTSPARSSDAVYEIEKNIQLSIQWLRDNATTQPSETVAERIGELRTLIGNRNRSLMLSNK